MVFYLLQYITQFAYLDLFYMHISNLKYCRKTAQVTTQKVRTTGIERKHILNEIVEYFIKILIVCLCEIPV